MEFHGAVIDFITDRDMVDAEGHVFDATVLLCVMRDGNGTLIIHVDCYGFCCETSNSSNSWDK